MIRVVNVKRHGKPAQPWEVYIGRKNKRYSLEASPLENIYPVRKHGRDGSIQLWRDLFETALQEDSPIAAEFERLQAILKEHGKLTLVCWCKPLACHGDVIKERLEK